MSDKTYIELCKNNKTTIQINIWNRYTGAPFNPSGAYYTIRGSARDNTLVSRSLARTHQNQVWATITQTITASAAEYDVIWEIHRHDRNIVNHCTKVLVVESC